MTKKSSEMEQFCESVTKGLFGCSRKENCCVTCGSKDIKPENFKDDLSRREFEISHMCQECQDSVFG